MAGYLGQSQPVAAGGNSVETDDIIDDAVTDEKLNSATLDQAVVDIDDLEVLALAGLQEDYASKSNDYRSLNTN